MSDLVVQALIASLPWLLAVLMLSPAVYIVLFGKGKRSRRGNRRLIAMLKTLRGAPGTHQPAKRR